MVPFKKSQSREKVEEWALVLSASSIPHQIDQEGGEWVIYISRLDLARSEQIIDQYEKENRGWSSKPAVKQLYKKTFSGLVVAFLLLAFYWFIRADNSWMLWFQVGNASAELIMRGELWRAATALFLHADNLHILSNVISCVVFCSVVCRLYGFGLGWILILISGITGNLLTAFFYRTGHYSVGASTAIFGAVGLIGAWRFIFWRSHPFSRKRAWIYIVVVLILLGILGVGRNADILAHLFGGMSGCVFGILAAKLIRHPLPMKRQYILAGFSVLIAGVSWVLALL
jgi:membrane associated rhomboid family serine protease